jgi:hypothetical protein
MPCRREDSLHSPDGSATLVQYSGLREVVNTHQMYRVCAQSTESAPFFVSTGCRRAESRIRVVLTVPQKLFFHKPRSRFGRFFSEQVPTESLVGLRGQRFAAWPPRNPCLRLSGRKKTVRWVGIAVLDENDGSM